MSRISAGSKTLTARVPLGEPNPGVTKNSEWVPKHPFCTFVQKPLLGKVGKHDCVNGVDKPEDELLARCYRSALQLADEHKIDSVAFPAISTGAFGYPVEDATNVAFGAIFETIPGLNHVKRIRFVLHSERYLEVHEAALAAL